MNHPILPALAAAVTVALLTSPLAAQAQSYGRADRKPKATPPGFCNALKGLPWKQPERIAKLITEVRPQSTEIGGTSDTDFGREMTVIAGLVQPARLSERLRAKLREMKQGPDGAYVVVTPTMGNMYHFGSIGGSMKCRYDVWGQRFDSEIVYAGEGPDFGQSCFVERHFGSYRGQSIVIQYDFEAEDKKATSPMSTRMRRTEVKVAATDKTKWGEVCTFKLK